MCIDRYVFLCLSVCIHRDVCIHMLICSRYISTTALNKWFIPNLNFFLLSYQNLPVPQVGGFGGVVLFGFFSADHHVFFLILLKIDENKVTAIICIIGKERYRWYY